MSIKRVVTLKDIEKSYGPLTFADCLKSYRLGECLSQKELASMLGITSSSLCDLERGRKIPSFLRASEIAEKIHISESLVLQLVIQDQLRRDGLGSYKIKLVS